MPIIRVQLTIPTTFNNLGMPSPQPLPQTVDTEGKSVDEYVDYYRRAGIKVDVLEVVAGAKSAVTLLQDYGAGMGPAPVGLQLGHADTPPPQQPTYTNMPGSLTPVQNLNDPDHGTNPFNSNPGTLAPTTAPTTPAEIKASKVKFLVAAAVLYFLFLR